MSEDVWSEQDTTPDAIEAALRELLRQRHAANPSLVPARVLNLVVLAERDWKGEISNRLERVGRYRASRTILCSVEKGRQVVDAVKRFQLGLESLGVEPEDRVLLLIGSANRDPEVFPDPDRYDLDRDTTKIASFGSGRHFCLGAALARLEARVALEELVGAVADYDIDMTRTVRVHSINVRGFASLPTTVTVR